RRRIHASFALSGLLRCPHDNATLTGRRYRGRWVAYGCRRAASDPNHPRPREIAETKLMSWIVAEADRLQVPDQVIGDTKAEERRVVLEARRERVTEAFLDGTIDKRRRDAELITIAGELEALGAKAIVIDVPRIDWSWPLDAKNAALRA